MEITGVIKAMTNITSGQRKSDGKPWRKQGFVIENNATNIATSLYFEVFNDRIDEMINSGMKIEAVGRLFYDTRATNYNGRWFNEVRGWKWEPGQSWEQAQAQTQSQTQQAARVDAVDYFKQQAKTRSAVTQAGEPSLPF